MEKAVRPAPAGKRVHYERRRPKDTSLYQLEGAFEILIPKRRGLSIKP